MTDRHTTYRESLEHNAYMLDLQIQYHLATYRRVQETMTDQIREERLVLIGELHQQLIDIKRKLQLILLRSSHHHHNQHNRPKENMT